ALRFLFRAYRTPGALRVALRSQRTHKLRWRNPDFSDSRRIAIPRLSNFRPPPTIRRHFSPLFFHESKKRIDDCGGPQAARTPALDFASDPPRIPRIRAHLNRRHQCLPAANHAPLSGEPRTPRRRTSSSSAQTDAGGEQCVGEPESIGGAALQRCEKDY